MKNCFRAASPVARAGQEHRGRRAGAGGPEPGTGRWQAGRCRPAGWASLSILLPPAVRPRAAFLPQSSPRDNHGRRRSHFGRGKGLLPGRRHGTRAARRVAGGRGGRLRRADGASGSGKSTLLNVLGCLDRPTSGEYFLGEEEVAQMEDDQLSEIRSQYLGFIFQSYNLLPQYTVVENIEVPLLYQGRPLTAETRERCVELAGWSAWATGWIIGPPAVRRPAAARRHRPGLVNDPHVILADEPTGNLDSRTSDEIMSCSARLNEARQDHHHGHARKRHCGMGPAVVRMRDGHIESDVRNDRSRSRVQG